MINYGKIEVKQTFSNLSDYVNLALPYLMKFTSQCLTDFTFFKIEGCLDSNPESLP
jgi:hypothetical protein